MLIPLLVMYFSGVRWAQELVCPTVNWELGIVENLQILFLLLILTVNIIAIFRKENRIEKVVFFFCPFLHCLSSLKKLITEVIICII